MKERRIKTMQEQITPLTQRRVWNALAAHHHSALTAGSQNTTQLARRAVVLPFLSNYRLNQSALLTSVSESARSIFINQLHAPAHPVRQAER
jgi:hypothetical protein